MGKDSIGPGLRGMGMGSAEVRLWGMGRGSAGAKMRGMGSRPWEICMILYVRPTKVSDRRIWVF